MLYYNVGAAEISRPSGARRLWHEVVTFEHQTWSAGRAVCACRPVRAFVRSFPRGCGAGRTGDPVRSAATTCVRSRFRPATGRLLRDLRRDRFGECGVICNATGAAAAASRGISACRHGCGVRPSQSCPRRFSASRTPHAPDIDGLMIPAGRPCAWPTCRECTEISPSPRRQALVSNSSTYEIRLRFSGSGKWRSP